MWGSTDEVAAGERVEWYRDLVSRSAVPYDLAVTDPATFRVHSAMLSLGQVTLSRHIAAGHQVWRNMRLIRRGDAEHYLLGLVTHGSFDLSQGRAAVRLEAGDVVLWDTSHPCTAALPGPGNTELTVLNIPRTMITLPADRLDAALGSRFTTGQGLGALFRQFLTCLHTHAAECAPQELPALEQTALDLASGLLAQRLNATDRLPPETRQQVLLRRIDTFIDHQLTDPQLAPRSIAAHHHISLRTLYALFDNRDEGVASLIRRRRLERCRTDLANSSQPIHTIAVRWGFASPSAFTHAFRRAFGLTPRAYRRSLPAPPGQ
ncbi:helix-turn-helix domain-containing protein [Nonomuraea sp. NPDC059022]|uniref:AraC-like ligand-binding domain-containing protein n=1 Tax=Nonomuraea sp. NPDC059022 TaxID=3346705 RepID=UPI0036D0BF97